MSRRLHRCGATGIGLVCTLLLTICVLGCRQQSKDQSTTTQPAFEPTPPPPAVTTMPTEYPASLKDKTDPLDVVQVWLAAAAAADDETLVALVPRERALQALKEVVLLRGMQHDLDMEHAVAMILESWKHKLSLFEKGSLEPFVAAEPDAQNRVVVTVRGKDAQSKDRYLLLVTLLRDKKIWRVDPDLGVEQELVPLDSVKPKRPAKPAQSETSTAPVDTGPATSK